MSTTSTKKGSTRWGRTAVAALAFLLLAALTGPRAVSAQVAASDIPQFMGTWNLPLDAQGQSFEMAVAITEGENGNAAATVSSDMGQEAVEEISLDGDALALAYATSAQGMTFPVVITLIPQDEDLFAEIDFADGQFFMETTAEKVE